MRILKGAKDGAWIEGMGKWGDGSICFFDSLEAEREGLVGAGWEVRKWSGLTVSPTKLTDRLEAAVQGERY